MPQPLVSIIILNYNAGQILLDCFESVIKTNYDNFEIIIGIDHKEYSHFTKIPENTRMALSNDFS